MPSPVGHSLITASIFLGLNRQKLKLVRYDFLIFLFIGLFPDLDFLPGLITGVPSRFHHGLMHSIFFGIIIGIIMGLSYACWKKKHGLVYGLIFSGVYLSHLVADFLGVDTSFPYGEQLFWPFSKAYFLSPYSIFLDICRSANSHDFFISLFSWHNLKTVTLEILICLPILMILYFRSRA